MTLNKSSSLIRKTSRRQGLTLSEVLVVIVILATLIGLLLPAVQKARFANNRVRCQRNLKQLAWATHNYHDQFKQFPDGVKTWRNEARDNWYGYTFFAYLLPYMDQLGLTRYYKPREATSGTWRQPERCFIDPNTGLHGRGAPSATVIPSLVCPSDYLPKNPYHLDWYDRGYSFGWAGITSYVGNGGTYSTYFRDPGMQNDGMFYLTGPASKPEPYSHNLYPDAVPPTKNEVTDGESNTLLFGERSHYDPIFDAKLKGGGFAYSRYHIYGWGAWGWTGGGNGATHVLACSRVKINYRIPENIGTEGSYTDVNLRMSAFGSGHKGGANFAFVDGSVRFLDETLNLISLQALTTRDGGD
ncbi:MAG: DUF1559 domain-containing protein [Gemmataceae bacterium]